MRTASSLRWLEPILLLFAAGFCIGLIFPLGRLAGEAGIPPLFFAGASAAGASLVLSAILLLSGARPVIDRTTAFYAVIAGQLTFAIPFGVLVVVIPHLGSGIPAILQSLAPIITLAIVAVIGLERPSPARIFGLGLGMAGALIIILSRNSATLERPVSFGWYLAALVTPAALAAGNVYRTVKWPVGQLPVPLAALTLAAAAIGIFLVIGIGWIVGWGMDAALSLAAVWYLFVLQSLATGIGYAFFFRLQRVGGPIYLSQISYVNTGVGVAFAVLFFAEQLNSLIWVAVALVFAGVALVNRTQARVG
jgi:drug/metabolite transporter (DMT)-like permease